MSAYWFKPKNLGYGAVPISWEGWVLALGSALIIAACVVTGMLAERQHWSAAAFVVTLCAILGVATFVATWAISQRRTDGAWRWRP